MSLVLLRERVRSIVVFHFEHPVVFLLSRLVRQHVVEAAHELRRWSQVPLHHVQASVLRLPRLRRFDLKGLVQAWRDQVNFFGAALIQAGRAKHVQP